jgi:hypothetical protein
MFHGPKPVLMSEEDIGIDLRFSEAEGDMLRSDFYNATAEHHRIAGVRRGTWYVGIQNDDIAWAEVTHVVQRLFRETQYHLVYASFRFVGRRDKVQLVVDVACRKLFLQAVCPDAGKTGILFLLVA